MLRLSQPGAFVMATFIVSLVMTGGQLITSPGTGHRRLRDSKQDVASHLTLTIISESPDPPHTLTVRQLKSSADTEYPKEKFFKNLLVPMERKSELASGVTLLFASL
ncbi:hypothetical protein RRG08_040815 [Elysia crispata]|uniref:Uncharacterized protein n=1 Tax=Elysia crispata TaxID=231223 RepID=A0AAE0Z956_9GAST|nr:hypothetical protein RRG08_040815 [Elysia crispata]